MEQEEIFATFTISISDIPPRSYDDVEKSISEIGISNLYEIINLDKYDVNVKTRDINTDVYDILYKFKNVTIQDMFEIYKFFTSSYEYTIKISKLIFKKNGCVLLMV